MELGRQDLPRPLVLEARQEPAQDAEARRHDPAGGPRVHALGEHLHRQHAADDAAERGRRPELLVVAAARVEAHDQARRPQAVREGLDVRGEVRAPALLARLDEDQRARAGRARDGERLDRRQRGERRVAVVRRPAPVEPVAPAHGRPGPEPLGPARHLGLLVEMAVEEHGLVAPARHVGQEHGRAAGETHDLHPQPVDRARPAPALDQRDRAVQVAVLLPSGIEQRRLGGDADVLDERRDHVLLPPAPDEGERPGGVKPGGRRGRVPRHGQGWYHPAGPAAELFPRG